jgi:hypothetical protein
LDRSSQAELERLRARFESLSLAARQTVHLASQAATSLHFLEKCGPILAIVEGQGYVERLPAEGTSRRSSATPTPAPPDRDGLLRDVPLCNTPGAQVSPAGGSVEVSRASTPTPTPSLESSRSNEFGRLTASRHQLESLHKRLARIETALDGVVTCVRAMTDTHGETVAPSRAGGTARLGRQGGKRLLSSLVLIASGALLGAVALSLYQSQVGP